MAEESDSRASGLRAVAGPAVTARVPAKVNLHLAVGPRRVDGYHDITTVFQAVSLYDSVTVSAARRLSVEVRGLAAQDVPANGENIAARAARALAEYIGRRPTVRISLDKQIPAAAGLAGGSADAAAALIACDALWEAHLDRDELAQVGASIGSDVPFLLYGGTALASGRGEHVTPVLAKGRYHWVLGFADAGLSTESVYAELDNERSRGEPITSAPPDGVLAALRAGDAIALGRALTNDLQAPALRLRPRLQRVLDTGRELGSIGAIVSGSGATCAFLTRSPSDAVALAAALSGTGVCRAVRRVVAPVPGARIVASEE